MAVELPAICLLEKMCDKASGPSLYYKERLLKEVFGASNTKRIIEESLELIKNDYSILRGDDRLRCRRRIDDEIVKRYGACCIESLLGISLDMEAQKQVSASLSNIFENYKVNKVSYNESVVVLILCELIVRIVPWYWEKEWEAENCCSEEE